MNPTADHKPEDPETGSGTHSSNASRPIDFRPTPVFVPIRPWTETPFGILRGSAILGTLEPGPPTEAITVYFEGNIYSDAYFRRFATRCLHAHGRLAQKYPTVARARILLRDLVQVGTWHPREQVVEVTEMALLADWCGWTLPVSGDELSAK